MRKFTAKAYGLLAVLLFFGLCTHVYAQPRTYANQQTNGVNGLCLLCSVANPNSAIDSVVTNYSTIDATAGLLGGAAYQTLIFPSAGNPGDKLVITVQDPGGLLNANVLGNITVSTSDGATLNHDTVQVSKTAVHLLSATASVYEVIVTPNKRFDRVTIAIASTVGLLNQLRVYNAYIQADQGSNGGSENPYCNKANAEQHSTSGLCVVCEVQNPTHSIDNDELTASELKVDVGLLGAYSQQILRFPYTLTPGDSVTLVLGNPSGTLELNLLGQISIASYLDSLYNGDRVPLNTAGIFNNIKLLPGTSKYIVPLRVNQLMNGLEIRLTGSIAGALNALDIYYACATPQTLNVPTCNTAIDDTVGTNGICALCTVDNRAYAYDNSDTTYSTLNGTLGLLGGYVEQTLVFGQQGDPGSTVQMMVGETPILVNALVLGQLQVYSANGDSVNNDLQDITLSNLALLDGASKYLLTIYPGARFDRITLRMNTGLAGLLRSFRIYEACARFDKDTTPVIIDGPTCIGGNQQTNSIAGICVQCAVESPNGSIDNVDATFTALKIDVSLLGAYAEQIIYFPNDGCARDTASIILDFPSSGVSPGVLGNVEIGTLNYGIDNNDARTLTSPGGNLVNILQGSGSRMRFTFVPGVEFNAIRIRLNGSVAGAVAQVNIYGACSRADRFEVFPEDRTYNVCHGTDFTLTPNTSAGVAINFYDARTGGNQIGMGSVTLTNVTSNDTIYAERISSDTGCTYSQRIPLYINVAPQFSIPIDFTIDTTYIERGIVAFNGPAGYAQYNWSFGDGSSSNQQSPIHQYPQTGIYTASLIVTTAEGCTGRAIKTGLVNIRQIGPGPGPGSDGKSVFVPNTFTPNSDGLNDVLVVRGRGMVMMEFRVYNKLGQLIFTSTDPKLGWDGTFKNELQPEGVYVYTISAKFDSGYSLKQNGSVTIIR